MSVPLVAASGIDHGERSLLRADPMDRDFAIVIATAMMDVLVAIKMDLTSGASAGNDTAAELQNRIDRACGAIEPAIRDLKQVAGMCREDAHDESPQQYRTGTGP